MKNEQILHKAIEKAVKNGWEHTFSFMGKRIGRKDIYEVCLGDDKKLNDEYMTIIFSHDFAKAFWKNWTPACSYISGYPIIKDKIGERTYITDYKEIPAWQYHLQQMVLLPDDERLKYIEKFL